MSGQAASIASAARAALASWRDLLALSRGSTWIVTALPFAVAAWDAERTVTAALVLGIAYFTVPFGLLRHGLVDLEARVHRPSGPGDDALRLAIVATSLPLLAAIVLLGGPLVGLTLLLIVGLALALASPRLAIATRPGLDLAVIGLVPTAAALAGLLLADRPAADLPWPAFVALWAWATATVALSAIRGPTVVGTIRTAGPQRTAWLALVLFGMAVLLVASLGGLGVLAGLGLALYALLPPMVITAPTDRPDAAIGAAAAAVADQRGLDALVGAWLALLLLQRWGVTDWSWHVLAVVVPTALTAYVLANIVAIRVATHQPRDRRSGPDDGRVPSVAVIVPCLDAAEALPATLTALRSQTYADFTILVMDGGSSDGSVDEAAAWLGDDGVIEAPPRADGWTARTWACQAGADRTASDLLLFVDPETVLAPVAVRHLVESLGDGRWDALSGVPRYAMPSPGEQAAVPGFGLLLFGFAPIWWSALTGGRPSASAFAHGPLLLVRRSTYAAAGGHTAVRGAQRDGPALARAVARTGGRVGTVHAAALGATRPARDVAGVVAAWRRLIGAPSTPLAATVAVMLLEIGAFIAPLAVPVVLFLGGAAPTVVAAGCLSFVVLLAARLALAVTQRQPLASILWHPVTVVVTLLGLAAGIRDHVVRPRT